MSAILVGPLTSGIAAGGAGAAANNQDSSTIIRGRVVAVMVNYSAAANAGTVVAIKSKGSRHPSETLLTLTGVNTNQIKFPRAAVCDNTGANLTYDGTHGVLDTYFIDDYVNVAISVANPGDNASVWLLMEE